MILSRQLVNLKSKLFLDRLDLLWNQFNDWQKLQVIPLRVIGHVIGLGGGFVAVVRKRKVVAARLQVLFGRFTWTMELFLPTV